jgi:hypothetical protein
MAQWDHMSIKMHRHEFMHWDTYVDHTLTHSQLGFNYSWYDVSLPFFGVGLRTLHGQRQLHTVTWYMSIIVGTLLPP